MDRVLVVLPNWFGETLFATPFLRALRHARPSAMVATLGLPRSHEVLAHSPCVDERIDFDEARTLGGLVRRGRLIGSLRERRFDTAFILRKSLSRSLLLGLAGIPTRVGFANPKSGWLLTHRVPEADMPRHKAATYLPLLEVVGVSPVLHPYEYTISTDERRSAERLLNGLRESDGRLLVILHPGANWPHKRWAPERFAALGDRLVQARRVHVVVTGGPEDVALAESITSRMREPATLLAGRTTLRQLAACLERAELTVSNDTGILHIAAALRRPVVALYGPTSPVITGPLGDPQRMTVLHHPDCCPQVPCDRPDRPPHSGMDAITVDEAFAAAVSLLEQGA